MTYNIQVKGTIEEQYNVVDWADLKTKIVESQKWKDTKFEDIKHNSFFLLDSTDTEAGEPTEQSLQEAILRKCGQYTDAKSKWENSGKRYMLIFLCMPPNAC